MIVLQLHFYILWSKKWGVEYFNRILERPEVKTLLQDFPEIQIWIARPGIQLEIICKNQ